MENDDTLKERALTGFDEFRWALAFLTVIPGSALGVQSERRPDFRRAAEVFPLVGVVIGLVGGVVLVASLALRLPALIAAVLAVGAVVLLTGALHEDGLADTADGFGGGATAERKLEIMDDSRIGSYGAVALIFSFALRIPALAALAGAGGLRAAAALIAAEAASRAAMVRLWHQLPAARLGGMAEETGPPDQQAMLVSLIAAAVIVVIAIMPTFGFWATVVGTLLLIASALGFARLTSHNIGGRTGDTLGACQQCTLSAFLIGIVPFAS